MRIVTPKCAKEAIEALTEREIAPIAGGTDVLVHWPVRTGTRYVELLDITGIKDFQPLRWTDSSLILGPLTTYWDVIRDRRACSEFPMLVEAARQVGAIQIQSRGTWAGNIVNASPAADGVPALMACDAEVELTCARGVERVRLDEFYLGYKRMRRAADQLVTAIRVPRRACRVQKFEKVGARRAQTITKVGVAMTRSEEAGWRVVASSVAPTVRRCPSVERLLEGGAPIAHADELLPAIRADVAPIDDIRSTAAYRERVLANVIWSMIRGVR